MIDPEMLKVAKHLGLPGDFYVEGATKVRLLRNSRTVAATDRPWSCRKRSPSCL